jgi:hypothetical protein
MWIDSFTASQGLDTLDAGPSHVSAFDRSWDMAQIPAEIRPRLNVSTEQLEQALISNRAS